MARRPQAAGPVGGVEPAVAGHTKVTLSSPAAAALPAGRTCTFLYIGFCLLPVVVAHPWGPSRGSRQWPEVTLSRLLPGYPPPVCAPGGCVLHGGRSRTDWRRGLAWSREGATQAVHDSRGGQEPCGIPAWHRAGSAETPTCATEQKNNFTGPSRRPNQLALFPSASGAALGWPHR